MKRIILFTFFLFIIIEGKTQSNIEATTSTGQKIILYSNNTWEYKKNTTTKQITPSSSVIGLKKTSDIQNETVINHAEYLLSYNTTYRLASLVSYELTKEILLKQPRIERLNKFNRDPNVKVEVSAMDGDYRKSGYDKGHLCPAADMSHSKQAMEETFYYSNISPQKPEFNRGIWKSLEELVRSWAIENEKIYIVTGPVLGNKYVTEENDLFIPRFFYKVILDYNNPGVKGIGFILPNENTTEKLSHFAVSIDSVEKFTGIDFFPALPDDQEQIIESLCDYNLWCIPTISTENVIPNNHTVTSDSKVFSKTDTTIAAIQCKATTEEGNQCKRTAEAGTDYCWQHKDKAENKKSTTVNVSSTTSTYNGGHVIHTGPRGGKYYINRRGNKTYIKRK